MAFWYDRSRARLSAAEISRSFVEYFLGGLGTTAAAKAAEASGSLTARRAKLTVG
jgi:hypothetical protein